MELTQYTHSKGAIKDVDQKGRIVTGYYASWGADASDWENPQSLWIDSDGDVFAPDAFNKTIAQNGPTGSKRINHLHNHNFAALVNKPNVLKADNFGLYFETYFPKTTLGNDLLKLYEAGGITEHSVMFNTIKAKQEKINDQDYQLIQEVKMWEGSSVLWGANERTPFTGIKSEHAEAQIRLLDSLMHNGTFSDETFLMIEKTLKDIKEIYSTASVPEVEKIIPEPAKTKGENPIQIFYSFLKS